MLLQGKNITKSFPGALALDAVDFNLLPGEVHALLGENGAGKSTLVKCLTGAYRRDAGTILLDNQPINPRSTLEAQDLGIGTVYQEVNLLPNLTVAENLYLGRQPRRLGLVSIRRMNAGAREILSGYGLQIDVSRELSSYSIAIQQIIAIARAVDLSGKVLILDEPTASLDATEVQMLFSIIRRLRDDGLGIIFISHFLDQVFEICDALTVLRNGRLVGTAKLADTSRLKLVNMMLGRSLEEEIHKEKDRTASVDPVQLQFKNFGRSGHIKAFDLDIRKREIVGVAGLLGSGRTEMAELLFGAVGHDSGEALAEGKPLRLTSPRAAVAQGFAFCPEDRKRDGIVADLSVRENIILALQGQRGWLRALSKSEQTAIADGYIARLDIRTPDCEKPVGQLSGGNQQKVILARWLATNPRFLILDEPTRGIDVGAHAEIIRFIEALCDEGMSLLVISSELEELVDYSQRVIVLRDRAHVAELTGDAITTSNIIRAIASDGHEDKVLAS
tara:strand:+ start:32731 stop:34242 length:1512 start_codon:yes stop_codon:yes gene_type:complete